MRINLVKRFVWMSVLMLLPGWTHAASWGIDQLMSELAQTRYSHARFSEKKILQCSINPWSPQEN